MYCTPTLIELAQKCAALIREAEHAGVVIDDGNVVDFCADNSALSASLKDIKVALVVAGLSERFPKATSM